MELGEIIWKLREARELTREDLAEMTGLDPSTIFRYEHNQSKVAPSNLEKIAKALKTSVPDIYAIKENPSVLEEPFTHYKGKSESTIRIIVELDGTTSTLNSWFTTLKKVNAALLILLFVSFGVSAQKAGFEMDSVAGIVGTSQVEYLYATKGYRTALSEGSDIKKGYSVSDIGETYDTNAYFFQFKALTRDATKEVACYILVAKSKGWGNEYFFCLPINNGTYLEKFKTDIASWDKTMLSTYAFFVSANYGALAHEKRE